MTPPHKDIFSGLPNFFNGELMNSQKIREKVPCALKASYTLKISRKWLESFFLLTHACKSTLGGTAILRELLQELTLLRESKLKAQAASVRTARERRRMWIRTIAAAVGGFLLLSA